jgi:hypothetical protein
MTRRQRLTILGTTIVFVGVVIAVMLIRSPGVRANDDDDERSLIKIGFEIAPVRLNLEGKNRALVGLGSFIVNAQGDCNGCHTAGGAAKLQLRQRREPLLFEPRADENRPHNLPGWRHRLLFRCPAKCRCGWISAGF